MSTATITTPDINCAHDALVPIDDLKPNPRNPNTHPIKQIKLLAQNIEQFGWRHPITVSTRSGLIVAGHGRLEAAQFLKLTEAPVDYQDFKSDADEFAVLVADNRLAELAAIDDDALVSILQDLDREDYELKLTGHDQTDFEQLLRQTGNLDLLARQDDVPPAPDEPQARPGDIYQLGQHRLLVGDATNPENWQKLMDGDTADAMWTDPPYGIGYEAKNNFINSQKQRKKRKDSSIVLGDEQSDTLHELLDPTFKFATENLRAGAPIYIAHAINTSHIFRQSATQAGFHIASTIVWVKQHFTLCRTDYHNRYEPIFYGWKKGAAHPWLADRTLDDIFDDPPDLDKLTKDQLRKLIDRIYDAPSDVHYFDRPTASELHPTTKPVALVALHLTNSTKPNQIIIDPFLGSGTTLITAEQLGRRCYGFELHPPYADIIIARWEALTGQKAEKIS